VHSIKFDGVFAMPVNDAARLSDPLGAQLTHMYVALDRVINAPTGDSPLALRRKTRAQLLSTRIAELIAAVSRQFCTNESLYTEALYVVQNFTQFTADLFSPQWTFEDTRNVTTCALSWALHLQFDRRSHIRINSACGAVFDAEEEVEHVTPDMPMVLMNVTLSLPPMHHSSGVHSLMLVEK
jgi:hypothetical protein